MMKPTSKKIGRPTRNAATSMAHAACSHAELFEQPVGQRAPAAGVFQEAADHGAQPDHDRDESEGVAEARLDGFQYLVRRHAGGQAHGHGGNQQREKGVQLHGQDQEK